MVNTLMYHAAAGLRCSPLIFLCMFWVAHSASYLQISYLYASWISSFGVSFVYAEIFKAFYSTIESEIFNPISVTCKINIL